MKKRTRRLASLLMALAIVCTLLPNAFALTLNCPYCGLYLSPTGWISAGVGSTYHYQYCYNCRQTISEAHTYGENDACTGCGQISPNASTASQCTTCKRSIGANEWTSLNSTTHYHRCSTCKTMNYQSHRFNAQGICNGCGYTSATSSNTSPCSNCRSPIAANQWISLNSTTHYHRCSTCNAMNYQSHNINAHGYCSNCGYSASSSGSSSQCSSCHSTIGVNQWTYLNSTTHYHDCSCTTRNYQAHTFDAQGYCFGCGSYSSGNGGTVSSSQCTTCRNYLSDQGWLASTQQPDSHYQICNICGTKNYQAHVLDGQGNCIVCGTGQPSGSNPNPYQSVSVTLTQNSGVYYFTDTNTQSGSSVYSLLLQNIYTQLNLSGNIGDYYLTFVSYDTSVATLSALNQSSSAVRLSDLGNLYLTIYSGGTWTATYTVYQGNNTPLASGTLSITIPTNSASDIIYTATLGETVALSVSDFQNFWAEASSYNSSYYASALNYVQITSVSGLSGALCYNHSTTEKAHNNAYGSVFYVNPTGQQKNLGMLSFVPNKLNNKYNTGTVTINFIAYGINHYNASTSVNGSITILYTNGNVQEISYNTTGGYTTLNTSDFVSVYKAATGSNQANPYFTVKFLDVPAYGKLYSGYTASPYYNGYGTELTKANIGSFVFSSTSSASSIDKVVYVPSSYNSLSDSVRYAVYSGSILQYIGTVNFKTKELVITYDCNSEGTNFAAYDFYYGANILSQGAYISFGTPSSGKLYRNGTPVTSADMFSYAGSSTIGSISDVTFVPKADFTGIVEIPFYTSSITTSKAAGTVRIYVVAKPFADVIPTSWAAPYINRLYASGIISGTSATTFSPDTNMKYGEALKMILLAAGYPKQAETGGTHWASGYLNLAYKNKIVSSTNVDLNAAIDRNTIAEIAAKALGLSKATSINAGVIGPVDSTNGYVYALYNAGIVGGDSSTGKNYFYGSRNITRAEVAKIICNISDYQK